MPVEVRPLPPTWPLEQLHQDWGQAQLGVHLHCGPQAQVAFAAAVWHPQVQAGPGHVLQLQAVGCFVSFMVDFLGGSTTGCHRWTESVRHGVFSTVVCDEPSARVPDRSHRSTESIGQRLAQADAGSCQRQVANGPRVQGLSGTDQPFDWRAVGKTACNLPAAKTHEFLRRAC